MNFSEFSAQWEEWKPFPKDKVNRSIEKKEKEGGLINNAKAKVQKAVKNYKTKSSQFDAKASRKMDSAYKKHNTQAKARDNRGERDKANSSHIKRWIVNQVDKAGWSSSHEDDEKQRKHNKKDKESRKKAERMLHKGKPGMAGLERAYDKPAVKGATKGGFKKEHMDFTQWLDSLVEPLYEVNDKPACPKGYKWDKKTMMCVPKTEKDDVGANHSKDRHPDNGPGYNVIGSHGMNGAPYAYEEPPTGDN